MSTHDPQSPAPVQRLVGRIFNNTLAKMIWDDFTLLGKCTIAVPVILLCYALLPVLLLIPLLFHILDITGVATRLERFLERVRNAFFK